MSAASFTLIMIRHSTSFYCRRCGQTRQFTRRGIDHRKHRLATILTFGLWGFVWFYLHQRDQRRSWRCSLCRGRQRPGQESAEGEETIEAPEPATMPIPLVPRR